MNNHDILEMSFDAYIYNYKLWQNTGDESYKESYLNHLEDFKRDQRNYKIPLYINKFDNVCQSPEK